MTIRIRDIIANNIKVNQEILENEQLIQTVKNVADIITIAFKTRKKVLLCGNGGSAAGAQHIAAELSGKFYKDRHSLFAEALHVDTFYLTATANDHSFDEVYSRQLQAKGQKGDILLGLSTSGNSKNILRALEQAKLLGVITVGLTGAKEEKMKTLCDFMLSIPSTDVPRIQEAHLLIGHIICEIVEKAMFGNA